jgi:benzoate-CoA ligase family protein
MLGRTLRSLQSPPSNLGFSGSGGACPARFRDGADFISQAALSAPTRPIEIAVECAFMPVSPNAGIPESFNICTHFLEQPAAAHPDRIAILGDPARVTYSALANLARRVAASITRDGIASGDRVLIVLPDSAEFIASFLGVARTGAIAVPVNPMSRPEDYAHYINDSGAILAIVHSDAFDPFVSASASVECLKHIVVVGNDAPRSASTKIIPWKEWLGTGEREPSAPAAAATRANDPAFFLYTSGSGGKPKAAIHEHKDMLATFTGFARGVLDIRADDRTYSVSKLFFAYGLGNGLYFPLGAGAATILDPERPRPERCAEILAKFKPTIFSSVPTFYAALLREAERGLAFDFSSVRHAVSAGERLPPEIFERFREKFGFEIIDAIGSTEMLHMFLSPRPGKIRAGSCGAPIDRYDAKIVDDDGNTLPAGEIGNLWVRGGGAFSGYWKIPDLTAHTIRDGWVVTGDKFLRDADGYYHYCGRADDMMKVAGMWVSPTEVENALVGHPQVAEAAVVAEINSAGLANPLAFVVLKSEKAAADPAALAEEIRDFVRSRLPSYKCPREIRFLDSLPKTATGKIQRFRLRRDT